MVARLPDSIPLMLPLIVSIGGKRARIHGAALKLGAKRATMPPANRLVRSKVRASRVWADIDLERRLHGRESFSFAPCPILPHAANRDASQGKLKSIMCLKRYQDIQVQSTVFMKPHKYDGAVEVKTFIHVMHLVMCRKS